MKSFIQKGFDFFVRCQFPMILSVHDLHKMVSFLLQIIICFICNFVFCRFFDIWEQNSQTKNIFFFHLDLRNTYLKSTEIAIALGTSSKLSFKDVPDTSKLP